MQRAVYAGISAVLCLGVLLCWSADAADAADAVSVSGGPQKRGRSLQQEGGSDVPQETARYHTELSAHGWINTIGLGVLIPLGITAAKIFKHTSVWGKGLFIVHIACQLLGLVLGIVGSSLGSQLIVDGSLLSAHKALGIVAVCLVGVQAVAALTWRPALKTKKRYLYQWQHWYTGRLAAVIAITNVFLGLHSQGNLLHYIIAYVVVLGALLFGPWMLAGLLRWPQGEPIFIPNKRFPAGKNADYTGTELQPVTEKGSFAADYPETNGVHPHENEGVAAGVANTEL